MVKKLVALACASVMLISSVAFAAPSPAGSDIIEKTGTDKVVAADNTNATQEEKDWANNNTGTLEVSLTKLPNTEDYTVDDPDNVLDEAGNYQPVGETLAVVDENANMPEGVTAIKVSIGEGSDPKDYALSVVNTNTKTITIISLANVKFDEKGEAKVETPYGFITLYQNTVNVE